MRGSIKKFKATVRNRAQPCATVRNRAQPCATCVLCMLMLDDFNQDLPALRKKVEEALNLPEQQTCIQRNAEQYEYLADEERDAEEEIRDTGVELSEGNL